MRGGKPGGLPGLWAHEVGIGWLCTAKGWRKSRELVGAHMYADRCAWRECVICVYSLPRWGARTEGAEEWTWEAEGRGLVPLGFLFSLEKNVVGIFFFS